MPELTQTFSVWCQRCGKRLRVTCPDLGKRRKGEKFVWIECPLCGTKWYVKPPNKTVPAHDVTEPYKAEVY